MNLRATKFVIDIEEAVAALEQTRPLQLEKEKKKKFQGLGRS